MTQKNSAQTAVGTGSLDRRAVGSMEGGAYVLRGKPLHELVASTDFVAVLWLAWTGTLPSEAERAVLNACLVAAVDHGAEPPSAAAARLVASCGKPLADAVAAGILTLGPRHGNAAGAASAWLRTELASGRTPEAIAADAIASKARVPGFGHPVYDVDPRTSAIFAVAKQHLKETPHADFASAVSKALTAQKGKPLPANVDGAIGAVIADLGAPSDLADALFIASRTVGLIAHARDEAETSVSYRR